MHFISFLVSIIVTAGYFLTFTNSKSCDGLFCDEMKLPQSNLSSYINQLISNLTSESPDKHANKIPFQGIIESDQLDKKCCYNGGKCFLGTFCICPKEYTGFQCEYEKWPRDCHDGIRNKEWVVRGCSLCRCFSGELHCLSPSEGCEETVSMRSLGTTLHCCSSTVFGLSIALTFMMHIVF